MASQVKPPTTGGSPPQSVEKITRIAQDYPYNPAIALRYWLRTASTLMREVRSSYADHALHVEAML
jgi:STAM-binding protein